MRDSSARSASSKRQYRPSLLPPSPDSRLSRPQTYATSGSAKERTSFRSASGAQVQFASEKATTSLSRLADGAVLRGHLAAARIADHARAGRLGELLRPVGGRVGGDDDLEPVGRVVELAEIRHAPLDHRLLVVRRDDHGDGRQRLLVGEHRPRAHARERPRRERVRGVRPHERARRSPEEDLCNRHRRSASLRTARARGGSSRVRERPARRVPRRDGRRPS